jgi:hypothetical protein
MAEYASERNRLAARVEKLQHRQFSATLVI